MTFLLSRISVLMFMLLCIAFTPLALGVVALLLMLGGLLSGIIAFIKEVVVDKNAVSVGNIFGAIIIGLVMLFQASNLFDALKDPASTKFFSYICICGVLFYLSFSLFRKFVWREEDNFYIDDKIHKLTKFYPTVIIISVIIRIVVEVLPLILKEQLANFAFVFTIGKVLGIVLFAVAIIQYIVRMIHIYKYNN